MENSQKNKNRILLVDDTLNNIELLSEFLEVEGYSLSVAQNGKQALDSLKSADPDLILLDIMMPVMDGFETCRRLKDNPETADIPVIFLTSKTTIKDTVKGFQLGAVDYLTKPFNGDELLARVKTHLELRKARLIIEKQKNDLEKQNNELKLAAKLREDVDNIIRHDLKAPLNAILGYPQILLERETLSEKGTESIKIMEQAGLRMLRMINLSLDLFRMERGVYKLNSFPFDIINVTRRVEAELEDLRSKKQLLFKVKIHGKPIEKKDKLSVLGEELLCFSLMSNLLKNAIEASPEDENVTVGFDQQDDFIIVKIHNMGVVPEEVRDCFFDKYTTSGRTTGTGLGTYSARLIAEIHRGGISMQTSEAEGTLLTIQLPTAQIAAE